MSRSKGSLWVVVGLLLVATALAAHWLKYDLLFVDEWWSIYKSGGGAYGTASLSEIWHRLTVVDPGGMGAAYYYALAGWEALVGASPFSVRLFSLLLGVMAVAMTYRLGALLMGRKVGVYAACLLVGSAFFIDFMHEARAYTLVVLTTSLSFYAYWRALTRPVLRWWDYAAVSLTLALLAYTHYVALAAAGAMGVYHVLFARKNPHWIGLTVAMGGGALLYTPWVGVLIEVAKRGGEDLNRQATSMDAARAVQQVALGFSNGAIPLLLMMLALTASAWRQQALRLLWLWLTVGLGLVLLVNAKTAFLVHPRYLIFLWPTLALIAAAGLRSVAKRGFPVSLLLGIWLAFGSGLTLNADFSRGMFGAIPRPPVAGINRAMSVVRAVSTTDDLTLFNIARPKYEPFSLFIVDYLMLGVDGRADQIGRMNNSFAEDDARYLVDVLTALGDAPRIYAVRVPEIPTTQMNRVTDYALNQSYADCGAILSRDDVLFNAYVRRPDDLRAFRDAAPYTFGDEASGAVKMTVLSQPLPEQTDASLLILMGWGRLAKFDPSPYSVSVQVVDATGQLAAQYDAALSSDRFSCTHAYLPMDELGEGTYSVFAVVYDRASGARLTTTGATNGIIKLGDVRRTPIR